MLTLFENSEKIAKIRPGLLRYSCEDMKKKFIGRNLLGCDVTSIGALYGKASVLKKLGKDYSFYKTALTSVDEELVI